MSKGAEKNYKFGQKNNWRRRVWNEIVYRLKKSKRLPKDALVLYLAGEQDLDRKIAIEKGFNPDNLIIIEKNLSIADKLRKDKKLVLKGDILEILCGWANLGKSADVIYGDFCCGLEPSLGIFEDVTHASSLTDAIILLNLQRGRDPRSEDIRSVYEKYCAEEYKKNRAAAFLFQRAVIGWNYRFHRTRTEYYLEDESVLKNKVMKAPLLFPQTEEEFRELIRIFNNYDPVFFSYNSGNVIMDSVVFVPFSYYFKQEYPKKYLEMKKRFEEANIGFKEKSIWHNSPSVLESQKQINAILAVRTMKLQGKRVHSPLF